MSYSMEEIEAKGRSFWRSMPLAPIAIHEAGHAVAAHVLGCPLLSATVVRDGDVLGRVGFIPADWQVAVKVFLAGELAEAFSRIPGVPNGAIGDRRDIQQELAKHSTDRLCDINRLFRETCELLHDHWGAVERVACELVFKRELDTNQLLAAIAALDNC